MQSFALQGEYIRLCDLLNVTRLCESGGQAKNIIATGVVKVDGAVELRKRAKIIKGQIVEYQGEKIKIV